MASNSTVSAKVNWYYEYAGLLISADFGIATLAEVVVPGEPVALHVVSGRLGLRNETIEWRHHWRNADDVVELSLGLVEGRHLLRFPGLADFSLPHSDVVEVRSAAGVSSHTIDHLLLDQVLPRWIARDGTLVLHASAVVTGAGQAILALGASGAGKSTLAASLAARAQGHVLADDGVFVTLQGDQWLALPAYAGLRLWPDSASRLFPSSGVSLPVNHYSDKMRVGTPPPPPRADGWPIAALLIIDRDLMQHGTGSGCDDRMIGFSTLPAGLACMRLIANSFQFDPGNWATAAVLLSQAAELAARIPPLAVDYTRDYQMLPEIAEAILDRLACQP